MKEVIPSPTIQTSTSTDATDVQGDTLMDVETNNIHVGGENTDVTDHDEW